ncbi:MAG: histidinol phosphatase [Flavobacterium sp.]|nr:histidinol phosphatase [Flavobacterium sp.]
MLFFRKNTPTLSDLIPSDYVDIHSHLLPGIDDGAKDINDSKNLLESVKKIGFSECIATPHIFSGVWENTPETITTALEKTKTTLNEPSLKAAAEYMMDSNFYDNLKKEHPLLTLKENYVLVEMSYMNAPIQLYDIIFEIQLQGYKPILAHPERYLFYGTNWNEFQKLKKVGCLFQLNLLSATGYYGIGVTKIAQKILDSNWYDFVGSDIHHEKHVAAFGNKIQLKNFSSLESIIKNNRFFSSPIF